MKIAILDAATLGNDITFECFDSLGTLTVYQKTSPQEAAQRLAGMDCVILNKVKLTADILSKAPGLKLICITATGYDNVDTAFCKEHGIAVCNVKGYSTECVTQLTISMALSLMNHITEFDKYVKSGKYTQSGIQNKLTPVFNEICGKTWGVVGLGNIGKRVAEIAEALGCRVLAFKRTPEEGYNCVDLDTLMRESDIISVHIPSSKETVGIISRERIEMMKKRAILINVARGNVVDEQAVADGIKFGTLYGFGCDVYSTEPFPEDHPYNKILLHDNVILTPHMAWGGYETRLRLVNEVAENIKSFIEGNNRNRVV